ncbi:50S ribosomal protein L5 [Candidatus Shapirobacteria bacterium CG11_big_fil_rev_8_21_14_0_20_40_12]|uniref:Large ribosomal subunit protein uL5 n=1 Tax=Candidatus Shapirobacteria bacterium CG11_big_fil_rev_8_21_14_0_20_40_12 TaxID=1974889 RepID=A0A2H0KEV8_9BACT|nr:MAG: 50S ribosomal protein L5 [Candidatus Shapirobacteria bacterium CG11_big_fil_rev_8_21_14_0_20_40_12]
MNLLEKYHQEIIPQLQKEMGVSSVMAAPRVVKVVINVGLKEAKDDKKVLETVGAWLAVISGQKAKICRAKKSIAGFKLGKGQPIGMAVTLRGKRAFAFLEKLFSIVLPRVRDFSGLSLSGFDGQGNYSLGISEQTVFSEIDFSKIDKVRGLQVTIVSSAKDDQKAKLLLTKLGMPFVKELKDGQQSKNN